MANTESEARHLVPELCKHFYGLGWVSGTGGGMSIRCGDKIFIAPSGVQKERIVEEDLFTIDTKGDTIEEPDASRRLKKSECTPLFMLAYTRKYQLFFLPLSVLRTFLGNDDG